MDQKLQGRAPMYVYAPSPRTVIASLLAFTPTLIGVSVFGAFEFKLNTTRTREASVLYAACQLVMVTVYPHCRVDNP
jgi:hypothetical protein